MKCVACGSNQFYGTGRFFLGDEYVRCKTCNKFSIKRNFDPALLKKYLGKFNLLSGGVAVSSVNHPAAALLYENILPCSSYDSVPDEYKIVFSS